MSYGRAPLRSRPRSVPIADIDLLGRGSELGPARCVVLANGIRELFALPPALKPAGLLLASGGRRTRRPGSTDGASTARSRASPIAGSNPRGTTSVLQLSE